MGRISPRPGQLEGGGGGGARGIPIYVTFFSYEIPSSYPGASVEHIVYAMGDRKVPCPTNSPLLILTCLGTRQPM